MQKATTYLLPDLGWFEDVVHVSPFTGNPIILGISYRLFGSLKKKQYLCRDIKNKLLN